MLKLLNLLGTSILSCLLLAVAGVSAEEYRAIFWNMESGDSNAGHLAKQMVEKGDIDLWGLSEVRDSSALNAFLAALRAANPTEDFGWKISEDGGADRVALIYKKSSFTGVAYSGTATIDDIGHHFFEVDSINVGFVRPAIGVQLKTPVGEEFVVLCNHWKAKGGQANIAKRHRQAIATNEFRSQTNGVQIVNGGDFNIPFNNGGKSRLPYKDLINNDWTHVDPGQDSVGSHAGGSILDGVFTTNEHPGWAFDTTILRRVGNEEASTRRYSDDSKETDHRPILLTITTGGVDGGGERRSARLNGLRSAIDELAEGLQKLREEVDALEAELGQ